MKNLIKPHPLMFFTFLKPLLVLALLPGVRAVIGIFFFKNFGGFRFSEAVFLIFLSVFAELRRKSLSLSLFDDSLVFKKGFYFKSEFLAQRQKISSVYLSQNIIECVFSVKTVFINVFSDQKDGYSFKITVKDTDAEKIIKFMDIGPKFLEKRFSFLKIAVFAVASSSTLEGLLIFVPILKRTLNFFGIGLFDTLFKELENKNTFTDQYVPQAVNVITSVLVFIYLFGFIYQFLKNINFKVLKHQNAFLLKSGFITKRESIINGFDIKAFFAEQTLILRVFKCFTLKAAIGGYTGRFLANGVIFPILCKKGLKDFEKRFLNLGFTKKTVVKKQKAPFGRFSVIIVPLVWFLLCFLIFLYLFLKFYDLRRMVALGFIFVCFFLCLYADTLIYGYNKGKISLNRTITLLGTSFLKIRKLYINPENVGEIILKENPFDKRRGSCKVTVTAFYKKPSAVTVRWINKADATEKFYKTV